MKDLILKESDVCHLTIRPNSTMEKQTHLNFVTRTLYYGEEEQTEAAIWISKKQAKQIIDRLTTFIETNS